MIYTPFCVSCWRDFCDGEVAFFREDGQYVCRKCSVKKDMLQWIQWNRENELMTNQIYCYCAKCGWPLGTNDAKYPSKNHVGLICQKCSERKTMPNIKITAEVDGRIVPLNTISTESFEAIKALEKPKEIPIPVARLVTHCSGSYLLLKQLEEVHLFPDIIHAFDLKCGIYVDNWELKYDKGMVAQYATIKPL